MILSTYNHSYICLYLGKQVKWRSLITLQASLDFVEGFSAKSASVDVIFGKGTRTQIASAVDNLGCKRAMVLCTSRQTDTAEEISKHLGNAACGMYSKVEMHTPVEVTDDAMAHIGDADCLVAVGGGSTTGLSKALSLRTGLPQVVLPTTYAGSEVTPILGQTEDGVKTTLTDPKVQPQMVIYDPELTISMPLDLTMTSSINAMAHAVEALYSRERNPLSTVAAVEGLRSFISSLPQISKEPSSLRARSEALCGAWLCGTVLGQVGMALHHKLCHALGGTFNLPHAETHAVILPHAIAYNEAVASSELAPLSGLLGGEGSPSASMYSFCKSIGAPMALRDLGLDQKDLDHAAKVAASRPYWNPRKIEEDAIRRLLDDAWAGRTPQAASASIH